MNKPPEQDESLETAEDQSSHSRLHRILDPPILFSIIALSLLAVIWSATFTIVERERLNAERAAAALTVDLADTYESRVVRALREVGNTLKLIRFNLEAREPQSLLKELRAEGLLPPEFLFRINITDSSGNVIASTHPDLSDNLASSDFLQHAREESGMVISTPQWEQGTDEWRLIFSRRLNNAEKRFRGVVTVSVHIITHSIP